VVFFPTRHVASKTRYLTDCRSTMLYIFWKLLASLLCLRKKQRELLPEMRLDRVQTEMPNFHGVPRQKQSQTCAEGTVIYIYEKHVMHEILISHMKLFISFMNYVKLIIYIAVEIDNLFLIHYPPFV
jgi:hypothetical protein